MESMQRQRMLWWIPLLVAILFAVFWGIWYLVAEEVPVVTQIKWAGDTVIQLPFTMSRLWDIVFAPIWAFLLIFLFTNKRIKKNKDLGISLVAGLVVGLVAGLVAGLDFGLVVLVVSLGFGLFVGLGMGLGFGLGMGLGFGLGIGLGMGLGFGLGIGLVAGLGFGLGVLIKFIFSRKIRITIGRWLAGKN